MNHLKNVECGFFAISNHDNAPSLTMEGLHSLTHRGKASTGMIIGNGKTLRGHKGLGIPTNVYSNNLLAGMNGFLAMGLNQFSRKSDPANTDIPPITVSKSRWGALSIAFTGNILNAEKLKAQMQNEGAIFQSSNEAEIILHLIARSKHQEFAKAFKATIQKLEGAFVIGLMRPDMLILASDPCGYRPLSYGQVTNAKPGLPCYIFSSETCTFDHLGTNFDLKIRFLGEMPPGQIITITPEKIHKEVFAEARKASHCIYETVFLARPGSKVFEEPVEVIRRELGRLLGKQNPLRADIVVPMPDAGVPIALGFSETTGIPYLPALFRNHYDPLQITKPVTSRERILYRLNCSKPWVDGKKIVLIVNSLFTGGSCRAVVELLRSNGAVEVHVVCPALTMSTCKFGVDIPSENQLLAAKETTEGIAEIIGANSFTCLPLETFQKIMGTSSHKYCYSCYEPERLIQI